MFNNFKCSSFKTVHLDRIDLGICEHWTWCDGVEGVRASLVRTADKIAACLCRKCFQAAVSIQQWPTAGVGVMCVCDIIG